MWNFGIVHIVLDFSILVWIIQECRMYIIDELKIMHYQEEKKTDQILRGRSSSPLCNDKIIYSALSSCVERGWLDWELYHGGDNRSGGAGLAGTDWLTVSVLNTNSAKSQVGQDGRPVWSCWYHLETQQFLRGDNQRHLYSEQYIFAKKIEM